MKKNYSTKINSFFDSEVSFMSRGHGRSPPELIDHLLPVVNNCYHVDYIFELKIG